MADAAPEPDQPSPETEFTTEDSDRAWAPDAEREVRRRLAVPPGADLTVECRTTICKLELSIAAEADPTNPGLTALAGKLESSLRGYATSVLLSGSADPGGSFVPHPATHRVGLTAYATFAR